jgi:hypothetical protein
MRAELEKVIKAIAEFYAREAFLLDKDLGERALTHRLAVCVERQFDGWEVDCDYNRLGERLFKLPHGSIVSTDDELGKSIFPDIVVHRRAVPENLLAMEVRKATNHQPVEHDHHKLCGMTDPNVWFAYRIGVLLVVGRGQVKSSDVYHGGMVDRELSDWFAGRLRDVGLAGGEEGRPS